ncbi:MAG TPA: response regulator transcription factor [Flavisolibacter sp.]|jgi:DNA-binding NarL/FixJ family response regulator|nr:response regulator transcription factor [Flavisolibacter sp.]
MNEYPTIRVFLADDHTFFRRGVRTALQSLKKENIHFMGEAPNGVALLDAIALQQPNIVLMDVEMPVMNGIEATTLLKQHYPAVRTIALSFSEQSHHVLAMVEAGADGYLLKDTSLPELTHAIKTVYEGYSYYTPIVSPIITASVRHNKPGGMRKKALTPRETEILTLVCEGKSSKEIACALFVSKRTVDSIREHIMEKTGAKNVMQLMRYALKEALITV